VNGTAGTEKTIRSKNSGQDDIRLFQEKNVLNNLLVNPEKVFLPPLHIKLGLMKNFVKGVDEVAQDLCICNITFRGKVMLKSKKVYLLVLR
jgi:hypothetical protein